MKAAAADPTAPLALPHFTPDARALGEADFVAHHGAAFLLHHGKLDPTRKPLRPQQTMILGRTDAPPEEGKVAPGVAVREVHIYPVLHTGRSPFPRIVTVGRTKNNDIVLSEISISKFHAFLKEDGGQYYLADGESRNGTFVDGERAPSSKQGKPALLKSGARVKFGALEFRFVDAKELISLCRQFG